MRLINVDTLELGEFFDDSVPPYVILSHRWSGEEITYKDFVKGRRKDAAGYEKVVRFCEQVRLRTGHLENPIQYAWIDTVCIDKRSSAELSEAINSMWSYYEKAEVCYVYLPDVELPTRIRTEMAAEGTTWAYEQQLPKRRQRLLLHHLSFSKSVWFKRGWTLQELLASKSLLFLTTSWALIGTMGPTAKSHAMDVPGMASHSCVSEKVMRIAVSLATRIRRRYLLSKRALNDASVAEKLSWLARRETTRKEDIAYCALGLLGIHMPLLYGEGDHAFRRLQEELIRTSPDSSIFAWPMHGTPYQRDAVLAKSPTLFRNIWLYPVYSGPPTTISYAVNNKGLELRLPRGSAAFYGSTQCGISSKSGIVLPLSCKDYRGRQMYLLLAEQACGHYDRQNAKHKIMRRLFEQEFHLLQTDKTVFVHTPSTRQVCQQAHSSRYDGLSFIYDVPTTVSTTKVSTTETIPIIKNVQYRILWWHGYDRHSEVSTGSMQLQKQHRNRYRISKAWRWRRRATAMNLRSPALRIALDELDNKLDRIFAALRA